MTAQDTEVDDAAQTMSPSQQCAQPAGLEEPETIIEEPLTVRGQHSSDDVEEVVQPLTVRGEADADACAGSRRQTVKEMAAAAELQVTESQKAIVETECTRHPTHSLSYSEELIRRNREIAQVRDLLHRREHEIEDWKARHGELVGRLSELDGQLNKASARARKSMGSDPFSAEVLSARTAEKLRQEVEEDRRRTAEALQVAEAANALRLDVCRDAEIAKASCADAEERYSEACRDAEAAKALAAESNARRLESFRDAENCRAAREEALQEAAEARRERNRAAETAAQYASDLDLESMRRSAETSGLKVEAEAAKAEVTLLKQLLESYRQEAPGAEPAADPALQAQLQEELQTLRNELSTARTQKLNIQASACAAKEELVSARREVETARDEAARTVAAIEKKHAADSQMWKFTMEASKGSAELIKDLENRLVSERHTSSAQLASLEEQLANARRRIEELESRMDIERRANNVQLVSLEDQLASEQLRIEELESHLTTHGDASSVQLAELEDQLAVEEQARLDLEARHRTVTAELKTALENNAATSARLEAAEAACLARSLESQSRELQLRSNAAEYMERVSYLEEELQASSRHEARARALQTECGGLRQEVGVLRRERQELRENNAMLSEEMRSQKAEASAEVTKLKVQIEETRRARHVDVQALIGKLATPSRSLARSPSCTLAPGPRR